MVRFISSSMSNRVQLKLNHLLQFQNSYQKILLIFFWIRRGRGNLQTNVRCGVAKPEIYLPNKAIPLDYKPIRKAIINWFRLFRFLMVLLPRG